MFFAMTSPVFVPLHSATLAAAVIGELQRPAQVGHGRHGAQLVGDLGWLIDGWWWLINGCLIYG